MKLSIVSRRPFFAHREALFLLALAVGVHHFSICSFRLYTEMDFRNEAANAQRMQHLLSESEHGRSASVFIPQPVLEHTTRCGVWPPSDRAKVSCCLALYTEY